MMNKTLHVRSIAVIGGGLIGAGWAALYALRGYEVVVIDPAADARELFMATLEAARPVMKALGTLADRPTTPTWSAAVGPGLKAIDWVQEALPEDLALKRAAYREIESVVAAHVPIASSSSGLLPSELQSGMTHPERLVIAHPCNPPYLMPVVEVVGGMATAESVLAAAEAFYVGLGKQVVRLHREISGHLVNRLQAALWREAVHLVAEGYAEVADVDRAVTEGLGARWAVCGPHRIFHLAGGERGMEGFLERLGPAIEDWWATLGEPTLDPPTRLRLVESMRRAVDDRAVADLAALRDREVVGILAAKQLASVACHKASDHPYQGRYKKETS